MSKLDSTRTFKTLKLRVKDKHAAVLNRMAREVNTVWNFCNETSARAIRDKHQFLTDRTTRDIDIDCAAAIRAEIEAQPAD